LEQHADPIRLKVFTEIVDDSSEGDIIHGHKRSIPTSRVPNDIVLAPGTSTPVDAGFWATFQSQSATSTLSTARVIFQVP
jgi:hypothetical protein